MEKGEVDARGGMVAGSLLMQDVQAQGKPLPVPPAPCCDICWTTVTTESHRGLMPVHTAKISMSVAEARVDYMSSCILLGQASQLEVSVSDLWEGLQLAGQDGDNMEEANIQVAQTSCPHDVSTFCCAGVRRDFMETSTASHPQNHHKIGNEHCSEDPRLYPAAKASQ